MSVLLVTVGSHGMPLMPAWLQQSNTEVQGQAQLLVQKECSGVQYSESSGRLNAER